MQLPQTHVKPSGIKILLWGVAILVLLNLLGRFEILSSITQWQSDTLTLIAALFLATEIGVMQMIKSKKGFTPLNTIGTVIIGLAILGVILGWLGVSLSFLDNAQSFIDLGLLVYVLIEIFN